MFNYNFLDNRPPTLYSILDSICNFDKENKTKISELAKNSRNKIFDFDYPLSEKIKKEDFETMILNKFLMRRIGYETMTAFKIQLYVKLNEIMPNYNLLFDAIDKWNLFKDGEIITRTIDDLKTTEDIGNKTIEDTTNKVLENKTDKNIENTSNMNNSIESTSGTISSTTTDNRYSELPQSQLENIQNADYMTQYTLTKNDNSVDDNSASSSESSSSEEVKETLNNNTSEDVTNNKSENINNNKTETIKMIEEISKSPNKKLEIYNNFIKEKNNIYTMIFKDLECLFYQLV